MDETHRSLPHGSASAGLAAALAHQSGNHSGKMTLNAGKEQYLDFLELFCALKLATQSPNLAGYTKALVF